MTAGAPKGNTNRRIGDQVMSGRLNIRCLEASLLRWKRAAKLSGSKRLSPWVIGVLDTEAERIERGGKK